MSQRGELITKKKDKLKMVVDISRCCGSVGIVDASDGEIRGSNPVFGEIYAKHVFTVNCCKDENKLKVAGYGTFFNWKRYLHSYLGTLNKIL